MRKVVNLVELVFRKVGKSTKITFKRTNKLVEIEDRDRLLPFILQVNSAASALAKLGKGGHALVILEELEEFVAKLTLNVTTPIVHFGHHCAFVGVHPAFLVIVATLVGGLARPIVTVGRVDGVVDQFGHYLLVVVGLEELPFTEWAVTDGFLDSFLFLVVLDHLLVGSAKFVDLVGEFVLLFGQFCGLSIGLFEHHLGVIPAGKVGIGQTDALLDEFEPFLVDGSGRQFESLVVIGQFGRFDGVELGSRGLSAATLVASGSG